MPLVGEPASNAAPPPAAAPRVLVCLPKGSAALEPQVERAFSWAALATIGPDTVARRFPPSAVSRAVGDRRATPRRAGARRGGRLPGAEVRRRDRAAGRRRGEDHRRLPPSVRHEAAYVRVQLLQGRVAQARGDARAAEAFARAGEAAVDVELDEAEYPPAVRRRTRRRARRRGRGRGAASSSPASRPGAEIEVNGQLAGTDAGEARAAAGALLPVAHARRLQAAPRAPVRPIARP